MSPQVLRSNWFHVLVALAAEDLHGSAITREVLDRTDGTLRLWPATLYRTLDDMVAEGLIEELTGDRHPEGGAGRKRYYRATDRGRAALRMHAEEMVDLAGAALERLKEAGA